MKKIIFQINVPNYVKNAKKGSYIFNSEMYSISERNARNYAKKYNYDYYVLTDANDYFPAAGKHLDYQKLKIFDFIDYERVIYFDSDYIIKDNAPDLSKICGNYFHAVNDPGKTVGKLAENLSMPRERYFNAGFMYLTKDVLDQARNFVNEYLKNDYEYDGQGLLNKLFFDQDIRFKSLPASEWNPVDSTFGKYADHYSGKNKSLWDITRY